ncbi:MAG: HEPN domain-containing protein [Patescibacteria group bacterium]|jgi:HEPN domain-containing protein
MNKLVAQINYWRTSAKRNTKTATHLYRTKDWDACLFFCHLTLEKQLKGLIIQKTNNLSPYIHDLAKLAVIAKLQPNVTQLQQLRTMTTFNIAGRYDDIKFDFHKKCTPAFTTKYYNITKELMLWLEKEFQNK